MALKIKDMIIDEIYFGTQCDTIYRFHPGQAKCPRILPEYTFETNSNTYWDRTPAERLATPEEKRWFLVCEKAGKFIPRYQVKSDEIINDYNIY